MLLAKHSPTITVFEFNHPIQKSWDAPGHSRNQWGDLQRAHVVFFFHIEQTIDHVAEEAVEIVLATIIVKPTDAMPQLSMREQ